MAGVEFVGPVATASKIEPELSIADKSKVIKWWSTTIKQN